MPGSATHRSWEIGECRRARLLARALSILLAAGTAACGNLTVGGFGEATVRVSGDASEPAPSSSPQFAVLSSGDGPHRVSLSSHVTELEGEIEIEIDLFLVSESDQELRLGTESMQIAVDLDGDVEAEPVDRQRIPALRYTALHIIFTEIEVEVDSGLIVDGVPIVGPIEVEFDDIALLVSRAIDLDVGDGESVELLIDLNVPAWLAAVDPVALTVDAEILAALLDVRVQ